MVPSYQKLGFRLRNSSWFFCPADTLQASGACQLQWKHEKSERMNPGAKGGRGAYNSFVFKNMKKKSRALFVAGQLLVERGPEP